MDIRKSTSKKIIGFTFEEILLFYSTTMVNEDGWLSKWIDQVRSLHRNVYLNEEYHAQVLKEQIQNLLQNLKSDGAISSYSVVVVVSDKIVVSTNVFDNNGLIMDNVGHVFKPSTHDILEYMENRLLKKLYKRIDAVAALELERIENLKYEFVLLKGIEQGNRFFTSNHIRPERIWNGKTAYEIIGFADTIEEAQQKLYNRTY